MEAPPGGTAPDPTTATGPPGQDAPPPEPAGAAAEAPADADATAPASVAPATFGGHPPPSPLSGGYLLIIIGEPHSEEHKDLILQRIAKGK